MGRCGYNDKVQKLSIIIHFSYIFKSILLGCTLNLYKFYSKSQTHAHTHTHTQLPQKIKKKGVVDILNKQTKGYLTYAIELGGGKIILKDEDVNIYKKQSREDDKLKKDHRSSSL